MIGSRRLVLDANILIRAALGSRVLDLLELHAERTAFYAVDRSFADARRYLVELSTRHNLSPEAVLRVIDQVAELIRTVEPQEYELFEVESRERIESRDAADWPILAACLLLDCPVWTEDQDFFGMGVATWTTRTVPIYLR